MEEMHLGTLLLLPLSQPMTLLFDSRDKKVDHLFNNSDIFGIRSISSGLFSVISSIVKP